MARVEVPECDQSEAEKVENWRLRLLTDAGYGRYAATVARARYVDLHLAIDIVGKGCPPKLATRILL